MSFAATIVPPRETWVAARDPRLKLAWLAAVSLASVLVDGTAALVVLSGATLVVALAAGWNARAWVVILPLLLAVVWGTMLAQGVFYAGEPRTRILTLVPAGAIGGYEFPGITLYREGMSYGLVQSLRIVAVMLAGLTVCLSTSPERMLAALARLGVPEALGFMTVTALRFVPTMIDQWGTVRRASRLRGYEPRLLNPWRGLRSLRVELALLVPVVAAALRRAATLATSLSARGFDATKPRTLYPPLEMSTGDWLSLAILAVLAIALSTVKSLYWLVAGGLLSADGLKPVCDFVGAWL